jgi:quinol monooxygenase YgiN
MIHVIATISLRSDSREKFLGEFAFVQPQVEAEEGCIEYAAAIDVDSGHPAQVPVRPDVVIVVEKWTSLDTLKAHLVAPHMVVYRERVKDYVSSVSLQVLTPVGISRDEQSR